MICRGSCQTQGLLLHVCEGHQDGLATPADSQNSRRLGTAFHAAAVQVMTRDDDVPGKLYNAEAGTIAGLKPAHFISMATPHLGVDGYGDYKVCC